MKRYLLAVFVLVSIGTSWCKAQEPVLWGMTQSGGTFRYGTIFSYNTPLNTEIVQHNLDSVGGAIPYGGLMKASNGLLYGLTTLGGDSNVGTLFSYNIATGSYIDIHDFGVDSDGAEPGGSLLQVNDTLLLGTTEFGGTNDDGIIFSCNITTGNYIILHNFGNGVDGKGPSASFLQASNGLLYATTSAGGVNDSGTVFSYNISTGTETVLHSFGSGTDGFASNSSLIQLSDSLLYGLTTCGGLNDNHGANQGAGNGGTIFSYNISTGIETILHNFNSGTDGNLPFGTLLQASDGLLYGMTLQGGSHDSLYGGIIIFSYNSSSGAYAVVHNFGNGTDGNNPFGSLIQASDGLLYGMTSSGGTNINMFGGGGTMFSYNIATETETVLHNFGSGNDGENPHSDLIEVGVTTAAINQLIPTPQLTISPNPTTGQFIIQLPGNANNYPTEIYNVLGKKIEETVLSNGQNTLNLSNQAAGMYFVYVHTEEGVAVGKVMIAK